MATVLNPDGPLAYGDNDGTVILRSPLTSLASITTPNIGSWTVSQRGTPTFDSVKGINFTSGSFNLTNISNSQNANSHIEISWDVETQAIACTATVSPGSSGGIAQTNVTGTEYFISIGNGFVLSRLGVRMVNKTIQVILNDGDILGTALPFNDGDSGLFTRFTLACTGVTIKFYIDGVLHTTLSRPSNIAGGAYTDIWLGENPFVQPTNNFSTGFMRNLQIAARPERVAIPPILSLAQDFGDSYAASSYDAYTSNAYNLAKCFVVKKLLRQMGFGVGGWSDMSFGGRRIIGSGNAALYLYDNIPTALAAKPTIVTFQAGRNDVGDSGALNAATFTASMKAIIERFMGVNGNPVTTVRKFIINTLPYSTVSPSLTDINIVNTAFATLPAWFDATYPEKAGAISVYDMFKDFGGSGRDSSLWEPGDLVHPSIGKGWPKMGRGWFNGILAAMR